MAKSVVKKEAAKAVVKKEAAKAVSEERKFLLASVQAHREHFAEPEHEEMMQSVREYIEENN